ncbi:prenyltransferase/squalene oxidase repeat-containing protein [Streptomyces nanshensis]|uniref:Squalene cyclase C-terminal domain-containing protein n=1 Tax=Streptomyces nanshensis TaxID=518642 RepID=A0A1E7L048_9ACTN|nr:prenyltransferase/squalene oxidase repeat-containing protein [Streptomyces nanshensis]OEV09433.1 hypothetical protein AN218_22015 [Streptomyces nanshensis]
MFLRRSIPAVAAAVVLGVAVAPTASAGTVSTDAISASPGKKLPKGLYGTNDPKYDGVWRQSVALLALDAAGAKPARAAVAWLAGQQCDDGSFTAYRADTGAPCDAKKTPGDTNATAAAVQALSAVGGQSKTVAESLTWLDSVQNKDGGWGYNPGSPSDANSVSVVVGAYAAAGKQPEKATKNGKSPYDALTSLQLGCDADKDARGAFAYQPGKDGELAANDDATAAAVLAATGSGMLVGERSAERPLEPLKCGKDADGKALGRKAAADAGAARLAARLDENGGHLLAATPGAKDTPDYANTADAVVALAASGHRDEAKKSLNWLGAKLSSWDKSRNDPAAVAGVMLAAHATGGDPAKLKGTDLLGRLAATGPKPAGMPGEKTAGAAAKDDGDSGTVLRWSLLGAGLAAGAGVGFLISSRRKKRGL